MVVIAISRLAPYTAERLALSLWYPQLPVLCALTKGRTAARIVPWKTIEMFVSPPARRSFGPSAEDTTLFYSFASSPAASGISNKEGSIAIGAEILLRLAGVKPNSEAIRIMISAWRFATAT